MVELALYGLVEVCLFSSLLGFFCRFHREGVFAFLVGAGLEVQESCLFIVVVEFLEYTLFCSLENGSGLQFFSRMYLLG